MINKKIMVSILVIGCLLTGSMASVNAWEEEDQDIELIKTVSINEPFDGYILYTYLYGLRTYLLNKAKNAVYKWVSSNRALSAYLLENGNLMRTVDSASWNPLLPVWGQFEQIEILDKKGKQVWNFEHSKSGQYCIHHDIEPLPNGNVLIIACERKTRDEAVAAGRNPDYTKDSWCPDYIIEVEPTGPTTGDIVWRWHVCDHIVQDFDETKENWYGPDGVRDHPELIDINLNKGDSKDWLHLNSIDYNEELDHILLSIRNFHEIWVIDHNTTTEEAAGPKGDLLYRWGNPSNYRASGSRRLRHQHDARWIESGCPGEGHITVFNNNYRLGISSAVYEIVPPVDENGNYYLDPEPGSAYGPEEPIWSIISSDECDFYSNVYSGAQRLPNGNTLICAGEMGGFYVVTPGKKLVWEKNEALNIFKMNFYSSDYPGLDYLSFDMENEQSNQQQYQGQEYQSQEIPLNNPDGQPINN